MRFKPLIVFCLVSAAIAMLCHERAFALVPHAIIEPYASPGVNKDIESVSAPHSAKSKKAGKPKANDDSGTTTEEIPVTINLVSNDSMEEEGNGEDDDEDDDDTDETIDPATVDLDPLTAPIDQTFDNSSGSYSVNSSGDLYYAPALNYTGVATLQYTINDSGGETSNPASVHITVNNVNDAPVITGQDPDPISTNEGQAVTLSLNHLVVTDPDNSYPGDFTLSVAAGANYTLSGNTVTPDPGYSGTLSVPVTISDGETPSNVFNVQITVAAVNQAPVITGQDPSPLTTAEEQPVSLDLGNLIVTDGDDVYPTGFTLQVFAGANYTFSGSTITPAPNFNGVLSVPVTVNDGEASSNTFNVQIAVSSVSDAPVITGQSPLSTDEDTSLAISLGDLQVTDNDNAYPAGFTLTLYPGMNYTILGTSVTPANNYNGTITVPATVNDGTSNSEPFDLQITVDPINDIPVITAQATLTTPENQALVLNLSHLTVNDPDNAYPAGFTMTVLAGANYSVSGTTLTPAAGFSGTLTAGVSVNDGVAGSDVFNLQITVNAINDAPVITGQNPLTVAEDTGLAVRLLDLTVTDADNSYPGDFTLTVLPGDNYTFSGNRITPVLNFTGILTVSIIVNDGQTDSQPFALQISVTPVNDAPQITGQRPLSMNEGESITLQFTDLVVADPDNTYPAGFTLTSFAGTDYTVSGNTITPSPGFNGTLTVQVQVNDGSLNSNVHNTLIAVIPVNNPPVITGQKPLHTPQGIPVRILLGHLTVVDPDNNYPGGFTLNVSPGTNYTAVGALIVPDVNFAGTLNISVTVNDGTNNSAPFIFQIQVGNANAPPVITGQAQLTTNEEQPITIDLSHLTVTDPDNPYPAGFTLLISPSGINFTVSGNTVTPVLNFSGMLRVPVRVNDGVNNSPVFDLEIRVNPVNDAPGFDAIPNQQVFENSAEGSITITNISKGPGEDHQQLTFSATSGNASIIPDPLIHYTMNATTATLTFEPVANASGIVPITVAVTDNGSSGAPHQNSYTATFQIEVSEVNNAPTLDAIANVTVNEDAEIQTLSLTGITAGAGENQVLTVEVSTDKAELFEVLAVVYTSPEATGSLQLKPRANASGVAGITVRLTDNGSSIAPGVNSVSRAFTFTVQAVNDPPVFISAPLTLAAVDEPYEYNIEINDVESKALPVSAKAKPAWTALTATGNGKAKLSGVPPAAAAGTTVIRIQVADGNIVVEQQYTLIVNTRPAVNASAIQLEEDTTYSFSRDHFVQAYSDADQHTLHAVQITQIPGFGKLLLADREIKVNDTIAEGSLNTLVYKPELNYAGSDGFVWKARDDYHFSAEGAVVAIEVLPVNDAPLAIPGADSLHYEVNGEPAALTAEFEIEDPDDETLTRAEIGFRSQSFQPEFDRLVFENTPKIKGVYDFQTGKLSLSGNATIEEYKDAIRTVQYTHLNTLDPDLEMKAVTINLYDGKVWGEPRDRIIVLQYTFIELEIPTGFTPNGDNSNDTWVITRPGGLEQLTDAVIKVFNRRGVQVFHSKGFGYSWDGTVNGEVLPADTYFYTIDLNLKSKKTYKGIVTILR